MKTARRKQTERSLPTVRILTGADVLHILGRTVFDDARAAGWLEPCCVKQNERGSRKPFFSLRAVEEVQDRMETGEYPGQGGREAARVS